MTYAEEWLGCTVRQRGEDSVSRVMDGKPLADLVLADPQGWLGAPHIAQHGTDPTFIVKLVDAGERLFLHAHPDRAFAHDHLSSRYGKAEGWVILAAEPDAVVYLGFARDVDAAELAGWVAAQDAEAMVGATNAVPVRAGDAVFCPGGLPHAIGAGILFAEIQEPTDLTVFLEWDGFPIDGNTEGHLGLGFERALGCVNRNAWAATSGAVTSSRIDVSPTTLGARPLMPPEADTFFAVDRFVSTDVVELPAGFSIVLTTDGHGFANGSSFDPIPLERGTALVVPHGAGALEVSGTVSVLRFAAGGSAAAE